MILISFGRKGWTPRKGGFEPKRFKGKKSKGYEHFFRLFQGSGYAKTALKKIKEADKGLADLDKSGNRPESPEYQKELRRLYGQKYVNIIQYWQGFRDDAKESGASSDIIRDINNKVAQISREWKKIQNFLK